MCRSLAQLSHLELLGHVDDPMNFVTTVHPQAETGRYINWRTGKCPDGFIRSPRSATTATGAFDLRVVPIISQHHHCYGILQLQDLGSLGSLSASSSKLWDS